MKIGKIVTRGVRGVPDGAHDLTDPRTGEPHSLVFVTGPSASGKTRLLEAVMAAKEWVAPYGSRPSASAWIRPGEPAAKVTIGWRLSAEEQAYGAAGDASAETESIFTNTGYSMPEEDGIVAVLRRYDHGHETGKLEYFPAYRPVPATGIGIGLSPFEQRPLRASGEPRKFASVTRVVHEIAGGGPTAEYFADILSRLSPTCRFEPAISADAFPRCFRGAGGMRSIRELSASEVDAVVLAATAVMIGLSHSVVLLDTPEMFADPAFLPQLAEGLLSLGQDVQVIAATRAPELLRGGAPNQVITLGGPAR
ncbi:MAG: hypothetical protein U0441_12625 [Polyangiaceae bacterium]